MSAEAQITAAPNAPRRIAWIVSMIYPLRIFGCAIALLTLFAVLHDRLVQPMLWPLILAYSLLWPHLAYWLSRSSADQKAAEMRNLLVDSFVIGGAWPVVMSFSVLPTLLMLGGISFDNITTGGTRLALGGLAAALAGVLLTGAILGFQFIPDTNLIATLVSAVCIFAFTGAVGFQSYRVSRHYVKAKRDLEQKAQELESTIRELNQARLAADAATRAKSQFLANMSHELRTPMNAIIGFADLALRSDSDARRLEHLRHIGSASRTLLHIINDILDLSKIEVGQVALETVVFEPRPLLDRLLQIFSAQAAGKGLQMRLVVDSELPPALVGDPARLEQVLMNLLGNALKFTQQGEVELRVRVLSVTANAACLEFSVRDTGIGLTPEQAGKLFMPFTQADTSTTRRFGGTGLGLAICRQLVELMGTQIDVNSVYGKGSTFYFSLTLPIASPDALVEAPVTTKDADQNGSALRLHGVHVLLVEDNALNRRLASEILRDAGMVVDMAENGEEALSAIRQETYDAVLMDVQMPVMDGYEATRAIRQLPGFERLPIIAMTANAMDQDRAACVAAGMDDFLAKPIDASLMLALLVRWLPQAMPGRKP